MSRPPCHGQRWGSFCTWGTQGPVGHHVFQLLRGCFQRGLLAL